MTTGSPSVADFSYEMFVNTLLTEISRRDGGDGPTSRAARKAVGSTPTNTYGHGAGGLFSAPGRDRSVFSAMLLPYAGIQSRLPVMPSNDTNPVFDIITGVTASTGSEPSGVCDDPPVTGLTKLCETSLPFGLMSRQSRVFDIRQFGRRVNRGELFDYQMVNVPFSDGTALPEMAPGATVQELLNNDIAKASFEMAIAWQRDFARMIWNGNPATDNTAGGGHKAFWGFSRLINDGYRDFETQALCTAADSYVADFQNRTVATNGALFYSFITFIYRRINFIANRTGLAPVKWAIAMPYSLFYEVTEIWPWISRQPTVTLVSGNTNFIESDKAIEERNDMRGNLTEMTGQFLLIDGQRVEVVVDDTIPETSISGGRFSSSVWFIPLTVLGSRPVTFMDYYDYRNGQGTSALEAARILAGGDFFYVSDNGRFMWHRKPPTNWCTQMLASTEPRLVCRTPYIGARIDNVAYAPLMHEPSWDPSSEYHRNGGKTSGPSVRQYPPSDV